MYSGFSDGFGGMSMNSQSSSTHMHMMTSPGDTEGIFLTSDASRSRIFMVSSISLSESLFTY